MTVLKAVTNRRGKEMQRWQIQKAKEIDGVPSECKRELATNFDCPSEQILGFYGAKLRINSQEMLQAIYRYNQRTREQGSTLTPVVAILTIFVMAAVLIAQSGLVSALVARFAQVVQ